MMQMALPPVFLQNIQPGQNIQTNPSVGLHRPLERPPDYGGPNEIEEAQAAVSEQREPTAASPAEVDVFSDPSALLPRFTKVRVCGNARTKNDLVGKEGVVKHATGLGGWHRVVLSTGEEVRLQRNALAVVSVPKGDETDFSDEEEVETQNEQAESLPRARRRRPTRPFSAPEFSLAERRTSQRQQAAAQPRINFHRLDSSALKRYRRFYKLPDVGPNSTKEQLVSAVGRHFSQQTVDEDRVIAAFVKAARHRADEDEHHLPVISEPHHPVF